MHAILTLIYISAAFFAPAVAHAEPVISSYESTETQTWIDAGFTNPDIKTVRFTSITEVSREQSIFSRQTFTHELKPTLILFRNSGWSERQVGGAIERAAEIYKQCAIKIEFAKLITVDPPFGMRSAIIDKPYQGLDLKIANTIPAKVAPAPIFYFVKQALNGYTAWAAPRYYVKPGYLKDSKDLTAMEHSSWITSTILKPAYRPVWKDKSYSVEAHELAHVLGNRNHVPDDVKNILGGTQGTGNDQITAEQCEAFRNIDLVKKLEPMNINP